MKDVIIFGNTQFSELLYYYLEKDPRYCVRGFTIHEKFIEEKQFKNRVIPFEKLECYYPKEDIQILVSIGYTKMNENRKNICEMLKCKGYQLAEYRSLDAIIETEEIGEGNIILEGTIIQPFVKLGNFNIIWSGCNVSHHSVIEDYCFLAPSVSIAGNVRIENNCFLGNHATIRNRVSIGHHALIGASAYVDECIGDFAVFVPEKSRTLEKNSLEIRLR